MLNRTIPFLLLPALCSAAEWTLIRTVEGTQLEGQVQARSIRINNAEVALAQIRSVHSALPASEFEAGRITQGLAAIQRTGPVRSRSGG